MPLTVEDDVLYAVRLNREARERLCALAGVLTPDESTIETPEPLLAEITKSLVGKPLEELMGDEDLVSRRPYLCSRCAGTFTIDEYWLIRYAARHRFDPGPGRVFVDPFAAGPQVHARCEGGSE